MEARCGPDCASVGVNQGQADKCMQSGMRRREKCSIGQTKGRFTIVDNRETLPTHPTQKVDVELWADTCDHLLITPFSKMRTSFSFICLVGNAADML